MRITIESTRKIVEVNGVPARVWQGTTAKGVPITCLITRVAVERTADASELEKDLDEQAAPRGDATHWPARLVL